MLIVELRTLEKGDFLIERTGLPDELGIENVPTKVVGPMELHCQVSLSGEYILATGWVRGHQLLMCDFCLKSFERPFQTILEIQFLKGIEPRNDEECETPVPESDLVYFEGESVDLGDEIRQLLELSVPMRSLCKDGCRGLCGGCGADLNMESCRCAEQPPDGRWAALKKWKP